MGAAELGLKDRPQTVLALFHVLAFMLGGVIIGQVYKVPYKGLTAQEKLRHKKAALGGSLTTSLLVRYYNTAATAFAKLVMVELFKPATLMRLEPTK